MTRLRIIRASFVLLVAVPILAQISQEPVDLDGIYRIKDEGLNRSQVMETLSYLTDVYGPRLTGSPQIKAAAEWTKKKLMEWELANVNLNRGDRSAAVGPMNNSTHERSRPTRGSSS